jgi:hypothetical protein
MFSIYKGTDKDVRASNGETIPNLSGAVEIIVLLK